MYNQSSSCFACYSSGQKAVSIYKFVEDTAAPSISLSCDSNKIKVSGTVLINEELANIISGDVVWTSSNTNVATVENGLVTGKAVGTTTIKATIGETSGEIDIQVWPVAGATLTIAEALKVCELTGTTNTTDSYVVEGVIEAINTVYDENNDRITVTITDGPDSIMVYRMSGGSDLAVGDKIIVTGKLVNYSSNTPEFATGSTYTKVAADEDTTAIKEALGKIAAYMSLGYTYTTRVETVSGVVDTLNRSTTGIEGTNYAEWTATGASSGVTYSGQSAGGNNSIQLRSNNSNSGIVTTTSIGTAKSVTVVWNSNTAEGRTLDIYGSNTAFTAATQLYNISGDIKKIGSIVCGTSTELEITGDYAYIGIRSYSGALYLDSIDIAWNSTNGTGGETTSKTIYESSTFAFRFAVDAGLAEIEGVEEYGIRVTAGDKEVYYTPDTVTVWGNDGEKCYVNVTLGNIINDTAKLETEFKVEAYVVVDGFVHVSEQSKTYSVATLVQHYMEELGIAEVEHLYNYLVEKGLI